ncbi:hypothetical protein ACLOJK_035060 [Asimina triloba]
MKPDKEQIIVEMKKLLTKVEGGSKQRKTPYGLLDLQEGRTLCKPAKELKFKVSECSTPSRRRNLVGLSKPKGNP